MPNRDIKNNLVPTASIVSQVITSDTTGSAVDVREADAVAIVISVGANAATQTLNSTNKLEIQLQESTGSASGTSTGTYTAVAAADIIDGVSGSTLGAMLRISSTASLSKSFIKGYRGSKRFLKVKADEFGTVSIPISATVLEGRVNILPTT
jgi:hypothetical protein